MPEISRIRDKYYIVATSSMIDPFRLVLKDGDSFGVFDRFGDILPLGKKEQGLYYGGIRFFSHYELKINGTRPLFLSSNIEENNILLTVDLTNPDIYSKRTLLLDRDSVHIRRSRVLFDNRMHERVNLRNFGSAEIEFSIELTLDSDFKDIFEVRGIKRKKRGDIQPPEFREKELRLVYEGVDGVVRTAAVRFSKKPDGKSEKTAEFKVKLKPGDSEEIHLTFMCLNGKEQQPDEGGFDDALQRSRKRLEEKDRSTAEVHTSNDQFNESIHKALSDINMMLSRTEFGFYPYGGIPWFCTPFGRDGLITAYECLWIKPEVAKGVLRYLASLQAKSLDRARASEPGKIMHEARMGEMAALSEVPFGLYYGSVDSTPLFVMLAGAYLKRTNDLALIKKLRKNIESAIMWTESYGDVDGDGFLEYVPDLVGLRNQGWKDSQDSVFHKDGKLAEGAIALCEVQGFYYAAKKEGAALLGALGNHKMAEKLLREADYLKEHFNRVFWDSEMRSYILALDGEKRPCRVSASNAAYTLFTDIADPEKACELSETLFSEDLFSGWGIRTLSMKEARYNPMSYHNGSIWPHDNAIASFGLAQYGFKREFDKVFTGMFEACNFMEFHRLPELFCGFQKRNGSAPTLYPVACSPQTWASGALIFMLHASLGLSFDAKEERVVFKRPSLPEFLNHVYLKNLYIAPKKSIDLFIRRYGEGVTIEVLRKPEDVSVQIIQ